MRWFEEEVQVIDVHERIARAQDATIVGRVYGEPYEKDGVTVIPAARVSGRSGSGSASSGKNIGGGFRVDAEPVGAYVIRGEEVEWQPVLASPGFVVLVASFALFGGV